MNEALLPVVNGLEFLSPPLPQEKQETLVRRVLEQGAACLLYTSDAADE